MEEIKSSRICFISEEFLAFSIVSSELTLRSSQSFILSQAEHLKFYGNLPPPNLEEYVRKKSLENQTQLFDSKDSFQPWCDYLFELISRNSVLQWHQEIIFLAQVPSTYFHHLHGNRNFSIVKRSNSSSSLEVSQDLTHAILSKLLNISSTPSTKIAIINFSSSVANEDKLRPKIHLEGLYAGQLFKFGDQWRSFRILNNQIPTLRQIVQYDVLLLTGSTYSVNSMCPQMRMFGRNLLRSLSVNSKLKILGTCFGHQFLSYLHGGVVQKRKFIKGPQNVTFYKSKQNEEIPFLTDILKTKTPYFKLFQYHNDHVSSIPNGFKKVGGSQSCNIQSLISNDKRIWTFQFHPQYSAEFINSYEKRMAQYNGGIFTPKVSQYDQDHHESCRLFRKSVRKFIDWTN